jgi:hypothetical protein
VVVAAAVVVVTAAAVAAAADTAAAEEADVAVESVAPPDLQPIAIAIGEAWVTELVTSLRSVDRDIIGAWPGTLREARARIRAGLGGKLDLPVIDALARAAYVAARRGWDQVSEADPEP